jgi:hypothetical protein
VCSIPLESLVIQRFHGSDAVGRDGLQEHQEHVDEEKDESHEQEARRRRADTVMTDSDAENPTGEAEGEENLGVDDDGDS